MHFPWQSDCDAASQHVFLSLFEMATDSVTVNLSLLALRLFTGGQGLRAGVCQYRNCSFCVKHRMLRDTASLYQGVPLGSSRDLAE